MSEPTVAAAIPRALLELAQRRGAERTALLADSGLTDAELEVSEGRVALARYRALLSAAKKRCKEPALGLHFGATQNLSELSVVGSLSETSSSFEAAMRTLNRYSRLLIDDRGKGSTDRVSLERDRHGSWLVLTAHRALDYPDIAEVSLARIVGGFRRSALSGRPFLRAVEVKYSDPGYRCEYERLFAVPVTFDGERNALLLDRRALAYTLPTANAYLFEVLEKHAKAQLEDLERTRTMKGQVETHLLRTLGQGDVSLASVADELGMSSQALYRSLRAEGSSYAELLDQLRHRLALAALTESEATVAQIAHRLGYSEPSAFSRAFKRWTGRRPGTVARENRGTD